MTFISLEQKSLAFILPLKKGPYMYIYTLFNFQMICQNQKIIWGLKSFLKNVFLTHRLTPCIIDKWSIEVNMSYYGVEGVLFFFTYYYGIFLTPWYRKIPNILKTVDILTTKLYIFLFLMS